MPQKQIPVYATDRNTVTVGLPLLNNLNSLFTIHIR